MNYDKEWKNKEELIDVLMVVKKEKNFLVEAYLVCLGDIINNWLNYAIN